MPVTVRHMLLCTRLDFDEGSPRDIRGIFNNLRVEAFPAVVDFGLVAWLDGPANGDFTGRVTVRDSERREHWRYSFEATLKPDGTGFIYVPIEFSAPSEAVYTIRCWIKDSEGWEMDFPVSRQ